MTDEGVQAELASLRAEIMFLKRENEDLRNRHGNHHRLLFGNDDGVGGILNDIKDIRTEHKYLRYVYVLATAVALPVINALLNRVGMGIKTGP